jgi:EAL domain-containing protein (putative c-di-GMP-specific phosphodiesterase class I)/DNA-binding NarL/FixJ family response regulator
MIRVLVADDEPAMLSALSDLIADQVGMEMVAAVENAEQAVLEAARLRPDVALLDVRMPGGGVAAVRGISISSPETKTLALSAERCRRTVLDMLEAGSVGYLTKGSALETIVEAIERAAAGAASLSDDVAGSVIDVARTHLTGRREEAERREATADRIRSVLEAGGFDMVFQPIFGLSDGKPVGYEALSRFVDGRPYQWFADAAAIGLGVDLQLAAAAKALAVLPSMPPGFLSINLSPAAIVAPALGRMLEGLPLERIIVEITEHARVADYDELEETFGVLRRLGLRLAIDDAGAGFASLRHILRLAPDLIKLDGTLIAGIEDDRSQQALARGLTTFAHSIDTPLVAEGIERSGQIDALSELGVKYGQGFFLGRPAPMG